MTRPRSATLRFLAEPTHVNFGGKVHGGQLMKWIDQAGYTCAVGWSGLYCVTSYVGAIRFLAPIRVGDLVELRSLVIHTGRTSIHIAIDVYSGDPKGGERRRVGHCVIVFVGVDSDSRPAPVPTWTPGNETDRALQNYALRLIELRTVMDTEMEAHLTVLERGEAEAQA